MNFLQTLHALIHGRPEGVLLFLLGVACYILARADFAIKSRSNGVDTLGQYVRLHVRALFVRIVVAIVVFFAFVPEEGLGVPGMKEWAVYFFGGLGIDAGLDKIVQKIPWLRVVLPPPPNGATNSAPAPPGS
jgi:hypothetical protein